MIHAVRLFGRSIDELTDDQLKVLATMVALESIEPSPVLL